MMRLSFTLLSLLFSIVLFGQSPELAKQYFRDGEYEKAAETYLDLSKKESGSQTYFVKYVQSLLGLEQYDVAEVALKKRLKKAPKHQQLLLLTGQVMEYKSEKSEANKYYEKAIQSLDPTQQGYYNLANRFIQMTKYDLAIQTLQSGGKELGNTNIFALNLADLYRRKGDTENMIKGYLDIVEYNPSKVNTIKSYLQRNVEESDYSLLKGLLFDKAQKNPEGDVFPELLVWTYIQERDYTNAFRQVKALDKRRKENGFRIYDLAKIAIKEKEYDEAISMLNYLIEEKGEEAANYFDANKQLLVARKDKVLSEPKVNLVELDSVAKGYTSFFNKFGKSRATAPMVRDFAQLKAFYLNDLDEAIEVLDELIQLPGIHKYVNAKAKLDLADIYLMKEERWEATLLYSQVDKIFKDDELGQLARFKNAKLSYYFGDFEWAQSQFDVLKVSTSKLIANDALDLSVFITDNSGLDTTYVPLELYAKADLLVFQRKFDEAVLKLDDILVKFPQHELEDDIQYTKATIEFQQKDYQKAEESFLKISENYPESIRNDNAIFKAAEINEYFLNNIEKAAELYKRIILEHDSSTFVVEARKKYRTLKDGIQ